MTDLSAEILEIASAHFERQRNQFVEVPEWGEDMGEDGNPVPRRVYFDPLTLRQRQKLKHRSAASESRQMALTVILHAKDKDGKLIFKDDAPTLATFEGKMDPKVVARIALRILQITPDDDLGN